MPQLKTACTINDTASNYVLYSVIRTLYISSLNKSRDGPLRTEYTQLSRNLQHK